MLDTQQQAGKNLGCRTLHHTHYTVEKYDGNVWTPVDDLTVFPEGVYHGKTLLRQAGYHAASHSVAFGHGQESEHSTGRFHFTDDGRAFIGTIHDPESGKPVLVRGAKGYDEIFDTERKPQKDKSAAFTSWKPFEIKTSWQEQPIGGPVLVVTYTLGDTDVSDRVRVVKVDHQKGTTTLEMPSGGFGPGPSHDDSFIITLAFGNKSFSGTYTDDKQTVYDWQGRLSTAADQKKSDLLSAYAPSTVLMGVSPDKTPAILHDSPSLVSGAAANSTLSLQDLDNVSSVTVVTDDKGNQVTVDKAQQEAGTFFNKCLTNGLSDDWVTKLFGHSYSLKDGVNTVFDDHKKFFQDNSTLSTGQMLYDNFSSDEKYKDLMKRVNPEKLKSAWENLGKNKDTAPDYQEATDRLYIEGYRYGVPGIQPYLQDDPHKWGEAYFNYLIDENNLLTWQIQIASKEFGSIQTRLYEWYTKLSVLNPTGSEYPKKMLAVAYSGLLGIAYDKMKWTDDIKPFLEEVIKNAEKGDASFLPDMQKAAIEQNQELVREMIKVTDSAVTLTDAIAAAIAIKAGSNPNMTVNQILWDPAFVDAVGNQLPTQYRKGWSQFSRKEKITGVVGTLGYAACAGFLIWTVAANAGKSLTAREIVEEINMGLLGVGLLVKGVQRIMTLGVGRSLEKWAQSGVGTFRDFAAGFAKWFSETGAVVPQGRIGQIFTTVFGKNYSEFFARRLGPVLAVFGLVLSSWFLADAIKTHDVRDIVFEALNTFFALADVVFIGLELLSFAWAGPVGLAVAAIGLVIAVVQIIWNLIDPPKPPPDPIENFVNGPMKEKGFAS